jgi:glycosyltransferase involved in cell wall biosynthesis
MTIDFRAGIPGVDVIIPAYNAARFLPSAIESVVAQTYRDWRIVLVDDGSTDDTEAVIAPYASRLGARLKYIRKANGGLPAARNTAVRNSSAELLALLDADDVWLPGRLARSVEAFRGAPGVGLVYGFISRIDMDGRVMDTFAGRQKGEQGWIASGIYKRTVDLPCPTVTFRRECVEAVGLFDESLRATEDRDLWLRIAQRYEVRLVPEVIAYYRVSPNAMTTDPERMLRAQLQFIEKHAGSAGCGVWARRVALGGVYRQRAQALGDLRAAIGSAGRALVFDPVDGGSWRVAVSLLLRLARLIVDGKD